MRYIMQQQLFSWTDKFTIQTEEQQDVYQVQGALINLAQELRFLDMAGTELALLQKRFFSWKPTYEIYRNGVLYAEMEKQFALFASSFTVELPEWGELIVEGDFFGHEYTFIHQQQPVATVSKEWFTFANTYGVEIASDIDPVLILACTVIIDQIRHDQQA